MQHTRVDSLSPGSLSYHNDVDDYASRIGIGRRARPALATMVPALAIALTLSLAGGMGVAHAKGGTAGTAKPPQTPPPVAPVQVVVAPPPAVPPPNLYPTPSRYPSVRHNRLYPSRDCQW